MFIGDRSEFGYKRLLSEKKFLRVQERARALLKDGAELQAILYKKQMLIFKVTSGTYGKPVQWTVKVQVDDATLEFLLQCKNFFELEHLIKDSGLKIHCDCPAWLYWGYKYMAWKKGYGLEREMRRPKIRNPHEQGFLCKHAYLVLQLYPFWSKALAKKFGVWARSKEAFTQETGVNMTSKNRTNRSSAPKGTMPNPNMGVQDSTFEQPEIKSNQNIGHVADTRQTKGLVSKMTKGSPVTNGDLVARMFRGNKK